MTKYDPWYDSIASEMQPLPLMQPGRRGDFVGAGCALACHVLCWKISCLIIRAHGTVHYVWYCTLTFFWMWYRTLRMVLYF